MFIFNERDGYKILIPIYAIYMKDMAIEVHEVTIVVDCSDMPLSSKGVSYDVKQVV
jgi:hypothetical protein